MQAIVPLPAHRPVPIPPEPSPSFVQLRAESQRLRLEFLKMSIDFSLTVADFAESKPTSDLLRGRCRLTAQKGYLTVLTILARAPLSETETADLRPGLEQLRRALRNFAPLPALVADLAMAREAVPPPDPPSLPVQPEDEPRPEDLLTPRELEVLRTVAKGRSTKQVAFELGMSFKTAACHRYRIMDKLGIHEVANLVRYAIRQGLVEP